MKLARRSLLSGLAAAPLAASFSGLVEAATSRTFFARHNLPIGLQVYTLAGQQPVADVDALFASIAQMGYKIIELPNTLGSTPKALRAAADKAGLAITSLHAPLMGFGKSLSLVGDPANLADALGELGAKWAVAPLLLLPNTFRGPAPGETFSAAITKAVQSAGVDLWKKTAALLNERASLLKAHGVRVGYHNHNLEFAPLGGTTGFGILQSETDPRLVSFEVDIGWVAAGGLDPVKFFNTLSGRVYQVHVKDLRASTKTNFAFEMDPTEVGSGKLAWRPILDAAYRAGARNFYVEQEPPFVLPRLESATKSIAFLKGV